jgi:hypothetical protein
MTKSHAQQQGEESKDNEVKIPISVFNPKEGYKGISLRKKSFWSH